MTGTRDTDTKTLTEELVSNLTQRHLTCATAESCTGGGVGNAITAIPGASRVFMGGIISYDCRVKQEILGVTNKTLESVGAVSEACAREMAEGARKLLKTDIAISITGLAGPGGDGIHPAGYVCFGLATRQGTITEAQTFSGNRDCVRELAIKHAIKLLLRA